MQNAKRPRRRTMPQALTLVSHAASAQSELLRAALITTDSRGVLFDQNPQPMCVVDKKSFRIIAANQSAAAMYGYRRPELQTLTLFELCDPAEHERLFALHVGATQRHANAGFWKQRRKGGDLLRVRAAWTSEFWGSSEAVLWTFEDQTPIERARAAAHEAGVSLSILLEDAPQGMCRFRLQTGTVEYANRVMLSICGREGATEARMYEPHALENCFVHAAQADSFAAAVTLSPAFHQWAQWRSYDGAVRTVHIYGYPVPTDAADRMILVEDITEQHSQAQESKQRENMESLGRIAATVGHDFNNILLVMRGYAEMMQRTLPPSSTEGRYAAALLAAADSAAAVTAALVGFTRKDEEPPRRVDLNEIAREMAGSLFPTLTEQITGRLALSHEALFIVAERSQMQRVLLNLAANARDAMPGGGRLTVATSFRRPSGGREECCVEIRDTGTGMDDATRARIFERFFTTKAVGRGTGLGLAFVESYVTQLGGRVEVESQLGAGSCFRLVFARGEAETGVVEVQSQTRRAATILLVDDDAQIRSLVEDFLKMLNYEVILADGAEAALKILSEPDQQVDLLLTDVTMSGMSGEELAERVRARMPSLPMLLMSGRTHVGQLEDSGFTMIQKPFSIREIQDAIEQSLHRHVRPRR
jgi:two-component system cell cycle sensor histidine kinase/response regulator CckA